MKTVLAHGCFDLLHLGHIRHLQEARSLGDRLVVSVTADEYVNKGNGRPHFTAEQRAEALRALDCVDEVFISPFASAIWSIRQIEPEIYVKGVDYVDLDDPVLRDELSMLDKHGGKFHTTSSAKWSSSRLINATVYPASTVAYLQSARERGFLDKIKAAFEKADKLNIVFVGESIIDQYIYVEALGKPSKEWILATAETGREDFHGGIHAASLHADWPHMSCVTVPSTLTKTRYVDRNFNRKLFEVYSQYALQIDDVRRKLFCAELANAIEQADVMIVLDFGHGLMTSYERGVVERAKFLAVNSQTNAGNNGFNPITKYGRADLACLDETEIRMATHMQNESIDQTVAKIDIHFGYFIVTRGRQGALCYSDRHGCRDVPAFSTDAVIDTMGAGDAFLAVAAPLVAAGLDLEIAAFVGNIAGAIKVSIVGHRTHVTRDEIIRTAETLLK